MSRGGLSSGNEKKEKIASNDNALDWNPPTMSEFRDVPITNTHGGTNSLFSKPKLSPDEDLH